jgi:hypothetical protein
VSQSALIAGLLFVACWLLIEIALWSLVRWLGGHFQWLITPADETPKFDEALIKKYGELSFDSELGWVRRNGTSGIEQTTEGEKVFTIDHNGCRTNPTYSGRPSKIAVFGDSFAFCRLVNDDETWPHLLSELTETNVLNFGVGNYGIDQAILRLEREIAHIDSEYVILGFVPETISRLHSYWRHYFEYGNILAFKPRFVLEDGKLVHHPSAMRQLGDFTNYTKSLEKIRKLDMFYGRKFQRDLLSFPYLPKILRQWQRTPPILFHLLWGRLTHANDGGFRKAFGTVICGNARVSSALYQEQDARNLVVALVRRFADICASAKRKPALLILPQPIDLERIAQGHHDYGDFYQGLAEIIPVLDMTERFRADGEPASLYIEGKLGPHPSPRGNRIIAEEVMAKLITPPLALEAIGK